MRSNLPSTGMILSPRPQRRESAFTRLELTAVVCALALLVAITLPVIAGSQAGSHRAACINNLSRIGLGYAMWSTEHGERYPWQVDPPIVQPGGDGTKGRSLVDHFRAISNEVVTPRILGCPSDGSRFVAITFDVTKANALVSSASSISYFLAHPFIQLGRAVLGGDRNVQTSSSAANCNQMISAQFIPSAGTNAYWSSALHARSGQLLFNDGSVDSTTDDGLRSAFGKPGVDDTTAHFQLP